MESNTFTNAEKIYLSRAELYENLVKAVNENDQAFMLDLVSRQNIIKPAFLLQEMYVGVRTSESSVISDTWNTGILNFTQLLDFRDDLDKMSNIEISIINAVRAYSIEREWHRLQSEQIDDWQNDRYDGGINSKDSKVYKATTVGITIINYGQKALDLKDDTKLETAREHLKSIEDRDKRHKLTPLLNFYVYQFAERMIRNVDSSETLEFPASAYNIIDLYASSELENLAMRSSLDKFLFIYANNCLIKSRSVENGEEYRRKAVNAVAKFASSSYRLKTLNQALGLS